MSFAQRPVYRPLGVILFLLVSLSPVHADDWPVPRGPSREPNPFRYDAAAWKKVPKEFLEDSSAVVLHTSTTHFIEKDGTVETTCHEITRLNGRKGIEALGEYHNIYFDPAYQKLVLNEARVIKVNGAAVAIEPRHVQLRDVATDYQVYNEDKQLVISFPNLEVGDLYEVKWTVRGKNPEFAGHFFTRYAFGDDSHPVHQDELHVIVHPSKTLKYATINGKTDFNVADRKEGKHYSWKVLNRPELPRDDDKPSKEELRLELMCSTFATWEEVAKWKSKLREECWKCEPAVRKVALDLTRDLKTPTEKARALTYWVRQRIRYLSRGPAGAGYTPHLPHQVLANLFGDCKDQAQLLAVMLKEVGLSPYLVTLGTQDEGQVIEDVPSPWGTHAILMTPIDGKEHWIDTTLSQAAWDYLPRSDRNRLAYLTRGDELKLVRTPALSAADNKIEQTTLVTIGADGGSTCLRSVHYHGGMAVSKRDAWIEAPPGERRRLMTAELQDANNRSKLVSLQIDDKALFDFDRPVRAQLTFQIPRHFAGDLSRDGSVTDSPVWNRLLAYTLDPDRKVPLHIGAPFESIHTYIFQLHPAFRFDGPPASQVVQSRWGFFKIEVQKPDERDPRRLELAMHTRLDKVRVDPADFTEFLKFHEEVNKAYRVWIGFAPTRDPRDIPLLESLFTLAPAADPITPRILAQLYVNQGKWDDARRVLAGACFWHWKDTGLQGAAHYQLARGEFQQGKPADALKHMLAALHADSGLLDDNAVLVFQARLFEALNRKADAIAAYKNALERSGEPRDILVPLIRLELDVGKTADGLDHLRRYTLAVGDSVTGLVRAADFHLQMGRLEDALELAGRAGAQELTPATHRILGLVHWRKKQCDKAVFHLESAEKDAAVLEGLIRCRLALGDLPAAERDAEAAERLAPATDSLRQARESVQALGKRRTAIVGSAIIADEKKDALIKAVNAYLCAERAFHAKVSADQVAGQLKAVFATGVEIGPAYALRGLLALEKGQLTKALADAEKALQLKPVEAMAFLVRGRIRLERGEPGALDDLTQAAALSERRDGDVLHWLAAALFRAGDLDKALRLQKEAVRLCPRNPDMVEQLQEFTKQAEGKKALVPPGER
ncbi:MAG: DUF3857 domain-containing protein [Planctomycetes bacterium]|nr:DUF3857 domain-containing protein [Planctomycetota bacterium]